MAAVIDGRLPDRIGGAFIGRGRVGDDRCGVDQGAATPAVGECECDSRRSGMR